MNELLGQIMHDMMHEIMNEVMHDIMQEIVRGIMHEIMHELMHEMMHEIMHEIMKSFILSCISIRFRVRVYISFPKAMRRVPVDYIVCSAPRSCRNQCCRLPALGAIRLDDITRAVA